MIDETTLDVRRASTPQPRRVSGDPFERELISLIPQLRAFSRVLSKKRATADDIVQDTLAKALRSRACFEPGTNMKAWLFTILRNSFYSGTRRAWRESVWDADLGQQIAGPANEQEWTIGLSDAVRAFRSLPCNQREALILVGAGGFTYEAAGQICDAPSGTIKSRVARGRNTLLGLLDGDRAMSPRTLAPAIDPIGNVLEQLSAIARPNVRHAPAFAR